MNPSQILLRLVAGVCVYLAAIPFASAGCKVPFWVETQVASITPAALATGDLNGDGRPDVIAIDSTKLYWSSNGGNFTFAAPVMVYSGSLALGVAAADFDGDGRADLVVADKTASAILFFRNAGNGAFGAAASSPLSLTPSKVVTGDFNGDGRPDVAVYGTNSVLAIYRNTGLGSFVEAARTTLAAAPTNMVAADIDADGRADLAVSHSTTSSIDLFYGNADSTLSVASSVDVRDAPYAFSIGRMTSSAFGDLLTVGYYGPMTVMRNLDGRSFAYPLTYSSVTAPLTMLIADFTGDGNLDVIVTNNRLIEFTGYGDGTLQWPFTWYPKGHTHSFYGASIASADFDGDGRRDVVVGEDIDYTRQTIWALRNLCGDSTVKAVLDAPVVSVGQPGVLKVTVGPPPSTGSWPFVSGTVTLLEGSAALDQKDVSDGGEATFAVSGLAVGSHSLVGSYGGDSQYAAGDSSPAVLTVTTETTTVQVSADPPQGQYGIATCFTPAVVSSIGKAVTGAVRLDIDGTAAGTPVLGQPCVTSLLDMGNHTVSAVYLGNATTPPSPPRTFDYPVARNTTRIGAMSPPSAAAGLTVSCSVAIQATEPLFYNAAAATGTLTVSEQSVTLATAALPARYSNGTPLLFQLVAMQPGPHVLKIAYSGDSHYTPAEKYLLFEVFPAASNTIRARGTADAIRLTFYSPNGWCSYRRMLPGGSTDAYSCVTSPFDDTTARANQVYLYRLESPDRMSHSNTDIAMRVSFTDDPLLPGMPVKAVHMTEIVAAVNSVRAAAGLNALTFASIAAGGTVNAADMLALRAGLTEACLILGATPPVFEEDIVAGQTPIRAAHIQELREAVR